MDCLTRNIAELESNLIEVGAGWIKTQYKLADSQAREKTLRGVLARLISATERHHFNPKKQ